MRILPWKRAQYEVIKGRADGFYAGSQSEGRDEFAIKSVVVTDQKWQWYLPKNFQWDTSNDEFRTNARVSSFLGANMQQWLIDKGYQTIQISVPTTNALADILISGRIDAALANNYVMDEILTQKKIIVDYDTFVLKDKPLYAYFGKNFLNKYPIFLNELKKFVTLCRAR